MHLAKLFLHIYGEFIQVHIDTIANSLSFIVIFWLLKTLVTWVTIFAY